MKKLFPVLSSLDIIHAVSVDDDNVLDGKMENPELIGIEEFLHAWNEEFDESDLTDIEDSGASTIGDLLESPLLRQDLKDKVTLVLDSKKMPMKALSFLVDSIRRSDIAYEILDDLSKVTDPPDEGTIWFLDKEMGGINALPEAISKIANKYLKRDIPCLIVIFTLEGGLADLNSSWEKRFDFLKTNLGISPEIAEALAYSLFVISKKAVAEELEKHERAAVQFVEGILLNSLTGYCTFNIVAKMKQYSEKAYDCLLNIAKDTQKSTIDTIRYNMVKEGEPNIYHSFKTIHGFMQEKVYTTQFSDVEKYILAIKRVTQMSELPQDRIVKQSIEDIVLHHDWAQYQFIHQDTNISFQDISYGDIFRIRCQESPFVGVLITQPCDCVLRATGDDKTVRRKASDFTLLIYGELSCDKASLVSKAHEIHNNGIIYEYQVDPADHNWKISYIDATKPKFALQVKPVILDLTSLDPEGKATLLNEDQIIQFVNEKKTQNWKEFIPSLKREILNIREMIHFLSEKIANIADVEKILLSIYNVPISVEKSEFLIQRIGHLDANLVEFASYYYTTHTYRTGKNSLIALHNPNEQGEV